MEVIWENTIELPLFSPFLLQLIAAGGLSGGESFYRKNTENGG